MQEMFQHGTLRQVTVVRLPLLNIPCKGAVYYWPPCHLHSVTAVIVLAAYLRPGMGLEDAIWGKAIKPRQQCSNTMIL